MLLSKSDFILACSCPKKLVFKKAGYPTTKDTNEYMQMLAKGGYIIGLYAQLMYPDGIEIKSGSPEQAAEETRRLLLENENITLFEACFLTGGKVVRTDILEKKGNTLHIIEVKSVSHDSENDTTAQKRKLADYILDVAYQTMVVKEAFPDFSITSSLFLPDKTKRTTIEGLAGYFHLNENPDSDRDVEELHAQKQTRFKKPEVSLLVRDHPDLKKLSETLKKDCLLSIKPCDGEVSDMMNDIKKDAETFLDILANGIKPHAYSINRICSDCEFNLGNETEKNGYRECWGHLSDIDPTIFDLINIGHIRSPSHGSYLDELIASGRVSFSDLDPERFKTAKGDLGPRGERQLLQFNYMRDGQEYLDNACTDALNTLKYPLHFIDFETYTSALPHHGGMRPYEKITFQWSCHTLHSPDGELLHEEYINDEYSFPNFRFAEKLMEHIGDSGTPLMWSHFENSTLKNILEQYDTFNYHNASLRDWLYNITSDTKAKRQGRFVDLLKLCEKYYFHPYMKGRLSIKKVLPAIWNHNPWLHEHKWFSAYRPLDEINLDPYHRLGEFLPELEAKEVVDEGTGAMMAYHDMMYGPSSTDPQKRNLIRQSLLNYCKLDTLAMVIIWKYWMNKK